MECHCIRAVDLPHTTRLYSSYLQDFPSVAGFYAHPPSFESVKRVASGVQPDPATRRQVAEILRAQNRQLWQRRLGGSRSRSVCLRRGCHRHGTASGPLFGAELHHIQSAHSAAPGRGTELRAALRLSQSSGWPREDHDLAEINHCFWPSRDGAEKIDLPSGDHEGHRAGEVLLGDAVVAAVERATAKLEGPAADQIRAALIESYSPSETYGSAFGKLLARLFAGKGLILLDPMSPELHRLAEPIYRSALEQHAQLSQELLARGKDLERAQYHVQVKVVEESTSLFVNLDGKRLPICAREMAISPSAGGRSLFRS